VTTQNRRFGRNVRRNRTTSDQGANITVLYGAKLSEKRIKKRRGGKKITREELSVKIDLNKNNKNLDINIRI